MASQLTQGTQATQAARPLTSATKCLIRTARTLPKLTTVWIQGLIVWRGGDEIAVDDGSGIARVKFVFYDNIDLASPVGSLVVGDYVMVVGAFRGRLKGFRIGVRATTVRVLEWALEALWGLEVTDAYLYEREKEF